MKNECEPEFIKKMRLQVLSCEERKGGRVKEKEEGRNEYEEKESYVNVVDSLPKKEVKCQICMGDMDGGEGMGCWMCLFFICLKCELKFRGFE